MEFNIPRPLKLEHEELHEELVKAAKIGGKIGDAAKDVATALHSHFEKEEEYALPPLGLLPLLARGEFTKKMEDVLTMTNRLKSEIPQMFEEHKSVVAALEKLENAALEGKNKEVAHFCQKLMLHAKTEEEVLYPAAILIGEYIKLKLSR